MSNEHISLYMERTSPNRREHKIFFRLIKCKMQQKHVLTSSQPLSYHFCHLGVNAFVATCQLPTCFEFTTRVLAPLPRSTSNTDKRAITVLLFGEPHQLLTFWRTWQGSLSSPLSSPHFDDKWPTTSSERGQRRPTDSTTSPSYRGGKLGQCNMEVSSTAASRNMNTNHPFVKFLFNVRRQKNLILCEVSSSDEG